MTLSVFFYSSEFLPFKGGVGRYTEDAAAMLSDGAAARVVVFTETAAALKEGSGDPAPSYRVIRFPFGLFARHPFLNIGINAFCSLAAVIRGRLSGCEWMVATGKRSVYNAAFFHPFLGRMKLAVILHGSEWSDFDKASGWRNRLLRRAFLRMCAAARLIIIPNRFTLGRFQSMPGFARNKSLLLHPIVNPDRVRTDENLIRSYRERYFKSPSLSLVTVARLTQRKGQDMVIRALGRLARETGAPVSYFIVGSGTYLEELQRLAAAERLEGKVHFLTHLEDIEAYSLVSLCDLFAMPNREHKGTFEGFGIAFLEANVLGVPALAGTSGGSTEAVEDGANGIICDGDDVDDVYLKIRRFQEDTDLRNRLKSQCRDLALARFSFDRWKGAYANAFLNPPIA